MWPCLELTLSIVRTLRATSGPYWTNTKLLVTCKCHLVIALLVEERLPFLKGLRCDVAGVASRVSPLESVAVS